MGDWRIGLLSGYCKKEMTNVTTAIFKTCHNKATCRQTTGSFFKNINI